MRKKNTRKTFGIKINLRIIFLLQKYELRKIKGIIMKNIKLYLIFFIFIIINNINASAASFKKRKTRNNKSKFIEES